MPCLRPKRARGSRVPGSAHHSHPPLPRRDSQQGCPQSTGCPNGRTARADLGAGRLTDPVRWAPGGNSQCTSLSLCCRGPLPLLPNREPPSSLEKLECSIFLPIPLISRRILLPLSSSSATTLILFFPQPTFALSNTYTLLLLLASIDPQSLVSAPSPTKYRGFGLQTHLQTQPTTRPLLSARDQLTLATRS
jgi:hypothetical protein